MALKVAPSPPGSDSGTPSSTYSGSVLDWNEPTPWMTMEMPSLAVRLAVSPESDPSTIARGATVALDVLRRQNRVGNRARLSRAPGSRFRALGWA
jgi:hypothetical protein